MARMGKKKNAYRVFIGKLGGKRALGRHRNIYEYNINMEITDIGWEGENWIYLAHDRGK